LNTTTNNGNVSLIASHDGYTRLKGKVIHQREVNVNDNSLTITDKLQGNFTRATVHWHLHPAIKR